MPLIERVVSKAIRVLRERSRENVPRQKQMTYESPGEKWYEPVIAGPSSFVSDCSGAESVRGVLQIVQKLTPDQYMRFNVDFYQTGLERFGDRWRYADINTVLYGIAGRIEIESYLEIGVRRGRSMAIVAARHPRARIVGFDLWIPHYVGIENPGPDFVHQELERVGYRERADFITGDSRKTVPEYFRRHPDVYFDVITVDGDHSARGARIDLRHVIPRLKIGGFLVFDDIANLWHPRLESVWNRMAGRGGRFKTFAFDEVGYGIAFGIRQY